MLKKIVQKAVVVIVIILLLPLYGYTQASSPSLHQPLSGKMLLSANYLELRDNHFHSGIDVKVGGVVGAKLFSINDGYISRIQVRAGGYGKCLYIAHHDGTTSVYAHLNEFADPIDKLVEKVQYEKQLFEVDTLLMPEQLAVSKGTLIGYAGNTGNSFGPHLHFEIRDTAQTPLNAAKYYSFTDKLAPELNTFAILSIDSIRTVPHSRITHSMDLKAKSGNVKIDSIINIESPAYIALECTDRMNETHNKFGIRKMKVELDGEPIFSIATDKIPFSQSRYINSLIAYDVRLRDKKMLIKSYVEQGNVLDIFSTVKNSGLIVLNDSSVHKLVISVTDDYDNTSTLSLRIREKKAKGSTADNGGKFFRWNKDNFHISTDLIVHVPKEALYSNILFDIEKRTDSTAYLYSPIFRLHNPETALHKPMKLAIKANMPDSLQKKVLVAYYGSELSSRKASLGGEWSNGYINVSTSQFGYFFVTVDTVPPTIVMPELKKSTDLRGKKEVRAIIRDDLSGIKSYNGFIDGKWVLFEYDAKNNVLIHTFDKKRTAQGKKHKLVLEVSDRRNNVSTFTSEFTW